MCPLPSLLLLLAPPEAAHLVKENLPLKEQGHRPIRTLQTSTWAWERGCLGGFFHIMLVTLMMLPVVCEGLFCTLQQSHAPQGLWFLTGFPHCSWGEVEMLCFDSQGFRVASRTIPENVQCTFANSVLSCPALFCRASPLSAASFPAVSGGHRDFPEQRQPFGK